MLLGLAACGGKLDDPTVEDAALDIATTPSDAGQPSYDDGDATDIPWHDASTPDANDAGVGDASCTVIQKGNAGGANCTPMILDCVPAVTGPLDCKSICVGHPESSCYSMNGGATIYCYYGCGGRRPEGFEANRRDPLANVGDFFANLAELEAASIDAFATLHDELASHDAPSELLSAAEDAMHDEVRHAKITGALAMRHGGRPEPREISRRPVRDLVAMAIENAREGCVRETFGALVAMHQAERASDPIIRRAMKRIARDETRHAELSWQVAAWLSSKLDAAQRARVDDAMRAAFAELSAETSLEPEHSVVRVAGVPSRNAGTRMLEAFRATLS